MKNKSFEKIIQRESQKLPGNIQHAINSFDWMSESMMIARSMGMNVDQVTVFQEQTMMMVLGMASGSQYTQNLMDQLSITSDEAMMLVDAANTRIFAELGRRSSEFEESEETPEHNEIAEVLSDEGIELLDHDVDMTIPKNVHEEVSSLQDQLKNQEMKNNKIYEHTSKKHSPVQKPPENKTVDAQELTTDIDPTDLRGVGGHRVDTSILEQASPLQKRALESDLVNKNNQTHQQFELDGLENTRISQNDQQDLSPVSKKDLLQEL